MGCNTSIFTQNESLLHLNNPENNNIEIEENNQAEKAEEFEFNIPSITTHQDEFLIPQLPTHGKIDYLPETPITTKQMEKYKYNCPICMNYYPAIYIASCCKHSICINCGLSHINLKIKDDTKYRFIPLNIKLLDVTCPHCNTDNVSFKYITCNQQQMHTIRKYQESPLTKKLLNKEQTTDYFQQATNHTNTTPLHTNNPNNFQSPSIKRNFTTNGILNTPSQLPQTKENNFLMSPTTNVVQVDHDTLNTSMDEANYVPSLNVFSIPEQQSVS